MNKRVYFFDDKNTEGFEHLEDLFPIFKFEEVDKGSQVIDLDKYLSDLSGLSGSNVTYSNKHEQYSDEKKQKEAKNIFPDSGIKIPDLERIIG